LLNYVFEDLRKPKAPNKTGVEAEGKSRRVEIPPQSHRRDGANVAAGEETSVDSEKAIAPRCRVSQSQGGRGRETRNRSLFFGRGRRSSVNNRQGDTTKEHWQADLLASLIIRMSRSLAREADVTARVRAGHGARASDRIKGVTADPTEKAMTTTDPAGKTRSGQRDNGSSREGRNNGESDRDGRDNDGSNEGDEGVGGGAGPAG
jgi:hypothetical protein